MQAIAELIGALVVAFAMVLVGIAKIIVGMVVLVLEFVFFAVTGGIAEAKQRARQRLEASKENQQQDISPEVESKSISKVEPIIPRHMAFTLLVVALITAAVIGGIVLKHKIRERRIAETKWRIGKLADSFERQLRDNYESELESHFLQDTDLWNQPIELQVDRTLIASLIVVRSAGPDQQTGTIDDLLITRLVTPSAKQIGSDVAERGFDAVKEKFDRVMNRDDSEPTAAGE